MNFKDLKKNFNYSFESSSGLTPEFAEFSRKFNRGLKSEAKKYGIEVVKVYRGHFEISGFLRRTDGSMIYFSVGDMRWNDHPLDRVLYRFARNERDYTGGVNHFVALDGLFPAIVEAQLSKLDERQFGWTSVA